MEARNALVAMTDDDCRVAADWLEQVESCFQESASIGLVFGRVNPGVFDIETGLIPTFVPRDEQTINDLSHWKGHFGMGANMAFRRQAVVEIGFFERKLGAGSPFRSGEDLDIALRLLQNGREILKPTGRW